MLDAGKYFEQANWTILPWRSYEVSQSKRGFEGVATKCGSGEVVFVGQDYLWLTFGGSEVLMKLEAFKTGMTEPSVSTQPYRTGYGHSAPCTRGQTPLASKP